MIPKECKRLAEVDFPIAEVSRHAAREKSLRHGHPSTLHLWWARRPLASSRAVLLGLLLPDPCDAHCPAEFKRAAREILADVRQSPRSDEDLQKALLWFIGAFANWDMAANRTYLKVARELVCAAYPDEPPLVVDPFAGGGSIPLEALRLGCEAFASDLNPVACLILKVLLEDIPRHGPKLAEELRRVGAEIKRQAEEELADLYPKDADGATPIAYLWARTVRCESPDCGAEIPIFRSPWLSKKGAKGARYFREAKDGQAVALLMDTKPLGGPVTFRVARGHGSEEAQPGFMRLGGTKARGNNANVICPCCSTVLSGTRKNPRTVIQLSAQRGGADVAFNAHGQRTSGAMMLAVVTLRPGEQGRHYRLPNESDYGAVRRAQARLTSILDERDRRRSVGLSPIPNEPLPPMGTLGFRIQRYGMLQWGDLFTARQKVSLATYASLIRSVSSLPVFLAVVLSRIANGSSSLCRWNPNPGGFAEKIEATFARQALPIVWDFAETSPVAGTSGDWEGALTWLEKVVQHVGSSLTKSGTVTLADATGHPLPDETASVLFTDPPYYDAVPYADLSDFFLVWLKRSLPTHPLLRDPFDPANPLSPKRREAVQDETKQEDGRVKDRAWFEEAMARAFAEGRRALRDDGVGSVVFAHKTTEGWEALLSGMIRGGWTITGSWPIATEMGARLRARDSAALATSVHLICRPRPEDAPVGDWGQILRDLPRRVGDWMERLQHEGVRGADLVFGCIGPALEVFSRYTSVEIADGHEVVLAEYLEKVWEVVGRSALAQVLGTADAVRNGVASAIEEDARLTALFLWALQGTNGKVPAKGEVAEEEEFDEDDEDSGRGVAKSVKGYTLVFDVVRRLAQPLGISLEKWERRIIETRKGIVRLLPVAERAPQLVEPGVARDAALLRSTSNRARKVQMELFDQAEDGVKRELANGAKQRLEQETWSHLHLDSISTLDHVHKAMLLQKQGQTAALRELLFYETEYRPEFLRLSNALSALYPKGSEEKRLLDALLLAAPR